MGRGNYSFKLFPTTHRSAVQGVRSDDARERERSWGTLVAAYWKPAYKHLRLKWKQSPQEAEDTVQSFFARALEREFFAGYDPSKARFRTFFKLCLDRHKTDAKKQVLQVSFPEAERELERAAAPDDPDAVFDREWKRQLFASAIDALKAELDPTVFAIFEQYDLREPPRPTYDELARRHGVPATTVTNHLAKARRLLREHVQRLAAELEDEA